MAATGPPLPSLQQRCLRVVASALASLQCGGSWGADGWGPAGSGVVAGVAALPQELRLQLLLLLASWQLLGNSTCALLAGDDADGVLAGAAAASLAGCTRLGGGAAARLLRAPLPLLRTLSLRGVARLTDAHVALLARNCPGVQQLDLSRCPGLTPAAVEALAAGPAGPGLRSLSLSGCWQLSSLPGLHACSQLTALDLGGCWQLRDHTVRQVLAGMMLLEELSLAGCLRLSCAALLSASLPCGALGGDDGFEAWPHAAQLGGPAAAAGHGLAWGGGPGEQAQQRWPDDAAAGGEAARRQLSFPVHGVALPQLRSLDVSGTAAADGLLLWLALRCCGRLTRLVLSNSRSTGLGLAALLRAKRALLHSQRCPAASADAADVGTATATSAARVGGGGGRSAVLPLLELVAAGPAALGPAPEQLVLTDAELREMQGRWEAALGGRLSLHPPSAPGCPPPPPLPFSLLWPPPEAACPCCLAGTTAADAWAGACPTAGSSDEWPPSSPAGVLASLGAAGLEQLQVLDVGGASGAGKIAELAAAHCRSLQRLRLAGCAGLDDASLVPALRALCHLRQLDVSGCCATWRSRPGSRFQRGKAPRLREGGVGDGALCLLGTACGCSAPLAAPQPPPSEVSALNASGLSITDAVLVRCAAMGSLTSLQLRGCKRLGDSGVLQVLSRCTQLARLDAAGCSQLTPAALGCYTPFPPGHTHAQQQHSQERQRQQQQQRRRQNTESETAAGWQAGGAAWGELPAGEGGPAVGTQQTATVAANSGGEAWRGEARAALSRLRAAVTTAAATRLQRAALPRQVCTREALAWLAGQASSSLTGSSCSSGGGGGAGSGGGPEGPSALQRLELASCESLAEADLAALAACCPRLKSLQLGGCGPAAGPALFSALAACCAGLTRLSLGAAANVRDAELALLLRALPGLQQLELAGCRGVSGAPFKELLAAADAEGGGGDAGGLALRTLRLDGAAALDDGAAAAAAACCPHLEVLALAGCPLLTAAAVAAALRACLNLRQLHFGGCSRIGGPSSAFSFHSGGAAPGVPGGLGLVELPSSSVRWAAEWRGCLGGAKLAFRDGS